MRETAQQTPTINFLRGRNITALLTDSVLIFAEDYRGVIMKKLILGTVALSAAGLVNVASAADMPLKAPAVAPVIYNWTGCYIGANGGFKWGRFNESADTKAGSALIPGVGLVPF